MSLASYWQRGETLDYTNKTGQTIENGAIIIANTIVGVAGDKIPHNSTGPLEVTGVFSMLKTDKTEEISLGEKVYFDGTGITKTEDSNTLAGYAAGDSGTTEEKVLVKLLG